MPFLKGTRVLAFENGLAGPLCSRLLSDLGADVVKVERPKSGDITRTWDTTARGLSSGFIWVNRVKRSVALDVKDPGERRTLERLVARSDVVLQNFTPGWAARVKLDEGSVRALRPDIVYVEISGYGPHGPYARRNAYDLVMQGEAGLLSLTGSEEQPARIGVSICDLAAGSYAATATLGRTRASGKDRRWRARFRFALRHDGRLARLLPASLLASELDPNPNWDAPPALSPLRALRGVRRAPCRRSRPIGGALASALQ